MKSYVQELEQDSTAFRTCRELFYGLFNPFDEVDDYDPPDHNYLDDDGGGDSPPPGHDENGGRHGGSSGAGGSGVGSSGAAGRSGGVCNEAQPGRHDI